LTKATSGWRRASLTSTLIPYLADEANDCAEQATQVLPRPATDKEQAEADPARTATVFAWDQSKH
jgi:hypothetical protein